MSKIFLNLLDDVRHILCPSLLRIDVVCDMKLLKSLHILALYLIYSYRSSLSPLHRFVLEHVVLDFAFDQVLVDVLFVSVVSQVKAFFP